jgi:hypothetical protein
MSRTTSGKTMGRAYSASANVVGGDIIHWAARVLGARAVRAKRPKAPNGEVPAGVCADLPELVVDAMKVVLEYETEWAVTGEIYMDERYLVAREIVRTRGGQW